MRNILSRLARTDSDLEKDLESIARFSSRLASEPAKRAHEALMRQRHDRAAAEQQIRLVSNLGTISLHPSLVEQAKLCVPSVDTVDPSSYFIYPSSHVTIIGPVVPPTEVYDQAKDSA